MEINVYKTLLDKHRLCSLVKDYSVTQHNIEYVNCARAVVAVMNDVFQMNRLDTEYMYLICADSKGKPIGIFEVSHGTVKSTLVSPREVIIKALLLNSVSVILVHNHPSGNVTPSSEDYNVTKIMKSAFDLVDLRLLDHIIIGADNFYSFNENNQL